MLLCTLIMLAAIAPQLAWRRASVAAWTGLASATKRRPQHPSSVSSTRLFSSSTDVDEYGRRIRKRRKDNDNNIIDNDWNVMDSSDDSRNGRASYDDEFQPLPHRHSNSFDDEDDGWGDDDDRDSFVPRGRGQRRQQSSRGSKFSQDRPRSNFQQRRRDGVEGSDRRRFARKKFGDKRASDYQEAAERRTNIKALEGAGFVHLYGLAPTLNALVANKRDFTRPEDRIGALESLQGDDYYHEKKQRERKPEAQFSPWLFLQAPKQGGITEKRSSAKEQQAQKVKALAEERGLPVAYVDKGALNTLSQNRPHQGFVLRCGKLSLESLPRLPPPSESTSNLWLALDEVVDPQNLGALLRSAYFLGPLNVLVCAKNSAPPSPVVSAASAGALEHMNVYSTRNLYQTLAAAEQSGYRVIGASSRRPKNVPDVPMYDLHELPPVAVDEHNKEPAILVLGSEGHGLRNLVATTCTEFVRIPGGGDNGEDDDESEEGGVDSLNVSVTGGILMWHLLRGHSHN